MRLVRGGGLGRSGSADPNLYQSDGVRDEMACQSDQLGSIETTSREALDKSKVTLRPSIIKS